MSTIMTTVEEIFVSKNFNKGQTFINVIAIKTLGLLVLVS